MNDALTDAKLIVAERTIVSLREGLLRAQLLALAACAIIFVGVGYYIGRDPGKES